MGTGLIIFIVVVYILIATAIAVVLWKALEDNLIENDLYVDDAKAIAVCSGIFFPIAIVMWCGYFFGVYILKSIKKEEE